MYLAVGQSKLLSRESLLCLDTLRKEVSGLGVVVGGGEGGRPLLDNVDTRGVRLEDESKKTDHRKTSMLDLLQLLLRVLLRSVVEAERVPASLALSPALGVTRHVVAALLEDDVDTTELHGSHEGEDLEEGSTRGRSEGLERVGVGEGISSSPLVARESSEARGDETNNGNHADTAVHKLGLTVPGQSIDGNLVVEESVEVGSLVGSLGGEEARVETNVSDKGSIEDSRCRLVRDGGRRDGSGGLQEMR